MGITPRWANEKWAYAADNKPIKEVMNDFASSQGMTLAMSSDIEGQVSGKFRIHPKIFIDTMSKSYGFTWYYDGVVLHISSAKNISSRLTKLTFSNTKQLREVMIRMGVMEERFPARFDDESNTVIVQGPIPYVDLITDIAAHLEERASKLGNSVVRIFPLINAQAADRQEPDEGGHISLGVASLLRSMHIKNSSSVKTSDSEKFRKEVGRLVVGDQPFPPVAGTIQGKVQNTPGPDKSGSDWWDAQQKALGGKSTQGFQPTPPLQNSSSTMGDDASDLPIIKADPTRNTVIVRDLPERMEAHEALIRQLDVRAQQIEIEIHILEIQREALIELGIDWRLHSDNIDAQTGNGTRGQNGFGGTLSGTANTSALTPFGGSLTAVVGNAGQYLLSRLIALESKGLAKISAVPKVATLNNQQATMSNEQTLHVKVEAFQSAQLYKISTGTVLKVTPFATFEYGGIWRIKLDVQVKDGRLLDTIVSGVPVTTESRISTQAVVGNGESLLLGGYEVDNQSDASVKVPGLSDIPFFGALFTQRKVSNNKFQKLFLVSPRILQ